MIIKKSLVMGALLIAAASSRAQDLQADNMLLFQRSSGGWFKQLRGKAFNYNQVFSDADKIQIAKEVEEGLATIDNEATKKEIRYLVKIYKTVPNPKYLAAAEDGIRYLLKAQYANGGFPQYYPDHGLYRNEITYNDNAMINALNVLQDVAEQKNGLEVVDPKLAEPAAQAVKKGVICILNTQIKVKGVLTGWCQQYNERTLEPAKARAYELPSISGSETVGIIEFLMRQPNPSPAVKTAITAGVKWLTDVKIKGAKVAQFDAPGTPKGFDKRVEADPSSDIWARYYEIDTNRPFFSNRDSKKVYNLSEVDYERRTGYSWYGQWPVKLLNQEFPAWSAKWN
ncbi:PelA/Pel-15E family pectate lyase [Mucilaginibacter yixingensis]|uniref:PelA/Pel-15E family pectate lyase n=1 Tax=Mucilaginibacter yixingensis TaxID=1295612 RepID=A0A2T5J9A4_9SPHI|nr:pectate lyase [Mucilaginibacter yixingensis]PTQ96589.1 PelA/Pel-15E family pectate lyase [Mucilaginibacter yixingensis]